MFTSSVLPQGISCLGYKSTIIANKSPSIEMTCFHMSLGVARKIKALSTH